MIPLLEHPPEFYVTFMAVLSILGTMIGIGHPFCRAAPEHSEISQRRLG